MGMHLMAAYFLNVPLSWASLASMSAPKPVSSTSAQEPVRHLVSFNTSCQPIALARVHPPTHQCVPWLRATLVYLMVAHHPKRIPPGLVMNRVDPHNLLQPSPRLGPHQARHVHLPALVQPRLVDAIDGDGGHRQQPEHQVLQLGRRGLDNAVAFAESAREVRVLDLRPGDLECGGQEGQHRQPEALPERAVERALQLQ
jgi:hypothetical protein